MDGRWRGREFRRGDFVGRDFKVCRVGWGRFIVRVSTGVARCEKGDVVR